MHTTERDPLTEVIETCRSCGTATLDWAAVMLVRHTAHRDEIEVTDADPLTVLCPACAQRVEATVRLAVDHIINPTV
ncbi:MAG: hypothetical protein ACRDQX_10990 [Pseudonocardiaceae bacterium]